MKAMMILSHLAIGVFCFGLALSLLNGATAGEDRFPGFTVGVQSYCFRNFDLDGALRNTRELGLKNIEFYSKHASHDMSAEQLQNVKAKLKAAGIKMVAYGVVGFGGNADANEKIFKFAKEMGFDVITADPATDSFDSLEKLVKKYDVKIAIHNHGPGSRYSSLEDVLKAVKGRDMRIGVCIDNGHFQRSREDSVQVAKKLGERVHSVHLKDTDARGHDHILGQGAEHIPEFLKVLRVTGFDGPLNLEYEIEPENPVPSMKKCLDYLSKVCKEVARDECIENLMTIDAAKEQWALENRKMQGDPIVEAEVNKNIEGGAPKCPSGGTYTYGKIGEDPRCSIPGHQL